MNESSAPACVGIILDGNRRWAKERGLPALAGHTAGLAKVKEIVRHAFSRGVGTVVVYAFSTENWNRTPDEVGSLMALFGSALKDEFAELVRDGVRVRFAGDLTRASEDLRAAARNLEEKSARGDKTLVVAFSYGGRAEIIEAARACAAGGEEITEEALSAHLWTAGIPDPDIIIRTGGEKRLSGFLTWGSVYSELFFINSFWPDFTKEQFDAVLAEFAERERRHGA